MKTFLASTIFLAMCVSNSLAQDFKPIRWMIRPGFQANIPLPHGRQITDHLISLNSTQFYFTALDAARFWGPWGIEIQSSIGVSNAHRDAPFAKDVERTYGGDNYVTTRQTGSFSSQGTFLVGFNYKVERARIFFIGRLLFGAVGYMASDGSTSLKQKNTNTRQTITWTSSSADKTGFMMSTGLTAGYRINKRLGITADIGYALQTVTLKYNEDIKNQNTAVTTYGSEYYDTAVSQLNIGVGIVIVW